MPLNAGKIQVLIVSDNFGILDGVRAIINSQPDMTVVGDAAHREDAVQRFQSLRPDVTIIDVNRPVIPGEEISAAIQVESPAARIIVITALEGDDCIRHAFSLGVRAMLYKDTLRRELLPAIRAVDGGQQYIPDDIAARLGGNP